MYDAQHSQRPKNDLTRAMPEQKPGNPKHSLQQPGDLSHIPTYTQVWGNQPPPWLRLPIQRQESHEEEALRQEREERSLQRMEITTDLPGQLKAGVENLSGLSMDDVHVHYNSAESAQVQALAYTQGTDIHVGSGQEEHLAHEAWHVVQQKQGRVKPTMQLKGWSINDSAELEREATVMGEQAASVSSVEMNTDASPDTAHNIASKGVVQRIVGFDANAIPTPFFRGVYQGTNKIVRPGFVGRFAGGAGGGGQSLNHIIGYQHIGESLVNLLNAIYIAAAAAAAGPGGAAAVPGAIGGLIAHLNATTDALFPHGAVAPPPIGAVPEYGVMVADRLALVNAITLVANFAAPTLIERNTMQNRATVLEADLFNAPENVRAGDQNLNLRLQQNIDADYGPIVTLPAAAGPPPLAPLIPAPVPAPWLPGGGAAWGSVFGGGGALANLVVGQQFYTLTRTSNAIVYKFINTHGYLYASGDISIVRNDDPANYIPGYTVNAPISSTAGPAIHAFGGIPVVVFDPTGAGLPLKFG